MLHNICMSAVAVTQVSEPWPVGLLFEVVIMNHAQNMCLDVFYAPNCLVGAILDSLWSSHPVPSHRI